MPTRPLDDLRVLDLTRALAGPSCTRLLVEMGADVIKVEPAPGGDFIRALSVYRNDRSLFFVQWNRGKKSVCIDFRDPRGLELIAELAARVDVVVENFRPGVIESLGLGYDALRVRNPGVVLCSISALGREGPLSDRPGYDYIAQAYAGVTSMIGEPSAPPVIPTVTLGDISTGAYASTAVLAALRQRDRTGTGQHVEVSLLDVYYNYHEAAVHQYSGSGGTVEPTRAGRYMAYTGPSGVFHGPWGDVVLIGGVHHWPDLCRALDCPELASDPEYATEAGRLARLGELVERIEARLTEFATRDAAVRHFERHGVPVAPVLSVAETLDHPHFRDRGTAQRIVDPLHGELDIPAIPLRFSSAREPLVLDAPTLGQHNAEVLSEVLGMLPDAIEQLTKDGVLSARES